MKAIRTVLSMVAVATAVGVGTVSAQDTERRDSERRLRELREEIRNLEQELGVSEWEGNFFSDLPRVLSLSTNRAQLGVYVQSKADDETDNIGAVLSGVEPGSAADEAGLREGDIVISLDGERLTGRYPDARRDESEPAKKLVDLVGDLDAGDEVTIEYRRGNDTFTTTATLERRENDFSFGFANPGSPGAFGRAGGQGTSSPRVQVRTVGPEGDFFTIFRGGVWSDIELVTLNEELGRYFGTDEGLLIIQAPGDEGIDLKAGDVILSIDGREPRTPSRALRILESYEQGETADFTIFRDRNRMTMSVTIPERTTWEEDGRPRRRRF